MSDKISLKDAEEKVFKTIYIDGLWDIFLGCFLLIFVIAPFLSSILGDLWSTVIFVPFWWLMLLLIYFVRKKVVIPRIGSVRFGDTRKKKLKKFTLIMLGVNVAAFVLGLIAAFNFLTIPGQLISLTFSLVMLSAFTLAAYFLDFKRLYIYGLLTGLSPLVGEWLFNHGLASHHGIPLTFGFCAAIMTVVGVIEFVRFMLNNPLPINETLSQDRS